MSSVGAATVSATWRQDTSLSDEGPGLARGRAPTAEVRQTSEEILQAGRDG